MIEFPAKGSTRIERFEFEPESKTLRIFYFGGRIESCDDIPPRFAELLRESDKPDLMLINFVKPQSNCS